mmetsp:Transcript_6783/g.22412  ORF Transcript_6783/g.22412 Transcript_6783/m.22412 type:complete len:238 (-) Transcript_6783:79-792(-)
MAAGSTPTPNSGTRATAALKKNLYRSSLKRRSEADSAADSSRDAAAAFSFSSAAAAAAASSFSRSEPEKARSTMPGASALGPSWQPPTNSPPIQTEGNAAQPVRRCSSARRTAPSSLFGSRSMRRGSAPARRRRRAALLLSSPLSQENTTTCAERASRATSSAAPARSYSPAAALATLSCRTCLWNSACSRRRALVSASPSPLRIRCGRAAANRLAPVPKFCGCPMALKGAARLPGE